jgi:hypothetical protein
MEKVELNILKVNEVSEKGTYLRYMNGIYQGITHVVTVSHKYVTVGGGMSYDRNSPVKDLRFLGPLPKL